MTARRVIYEGRVQGVGFRWTARKLAQGYDVTGKIRNLPDGRVELHAAGDATEVRDFLKELRESALAGHIASEHTEDVEMNEPMRGFQIVP